MSTNEKLKIKYSDETTDAYSGQVNITIFAINPDTGDTYGYLDYSIFQDEVYIDMIKTWEQYRRKGVAEGLYNKLLELEPGKKIHWGMASKEGWAFRQYIESKESGKMAARILTLESGLRVTGRDLFKGTTGIIGDIQEHRVELIDGKGNHLTWIPKTIFTQNFYIISPEIGFEKKERYVSIKSEMGGIGMGKIDPDGYLIWRAGVWIPQTDRVEIDKRLREGILEVIDDGGAMYKDAISGLDLPPTYQVEIDKDHNPFCVAWLNREDLSDNFSQEDIALLDESDIKRIADKMGDAYMEHGYWVDLSIIAEDVINDKKNEPGTNTPSGTYPMPGDFVECIGSDDTLIPVGALGVIEGIEDKKKDQYEVTFNPSPMPWWDKGAITSSGGPSRMIYAKDLKHIDMIERTFQYFPGLPHAHSAKTIKKTVKLFSVDFNKIATKRVESAKPSVKHNVAAYIKEVWHWGTAYKRPDGDWDFRKDRSDEVHIVKPRHIKIYGVLGSKERINVGDRVKVIGGLMSYHDWAKGYIGTVKSIKPRTGMPPEYYIDIDGKEIFTWNVEKVAASSEIRNPEDVVQMAITMSEHPEFGWSWTKEIVSAFGKEGGYTKDCDWENLREYIIMMDDHKREELYCALNDSLLEVEEE